MGPFTGSRDPIFDSHLRPTRRNLHKELQGTRLKKKMNIQLKNYTKGAFAAVAMAALISTASAQRWPDRTPDRQAFNTTMEGRGTVHFNGATYSFRELQVTLQNNRRVTVHAFLSGRDKDVVFTGKLEDRNGRSGRFNADIEGVAYGRDNDAADATCEIDMGTGQRFDSVTIRGRNRSDRNNLSLDFTSTREVTDSRWPDRDRGRDGDRDRDRDRDRDGNNGRWRAAGSYVDKDEWRGRGDHFLVRYALNLGRDGRARLVVASLEDRNMPDDKKSRYDHGDILKYLQHGRDVIQTGRWTQNGDEIMIRFDRIQTGDGSRDKDEVLRGRMRNGTVWIDDYEKSFYGHHVSLSFERD